MDARATRLERNFEYVIYGRRALAPHTASLFVEGLYTQQNAASHAHNSITSRAASRRFKP